MSRPSQKIDNAGSDLDSSSCNRLPVRILDDGQWLFIRKRFRMSTRELDVVKLVCGGLSNEEIATRLGIKSTTVKTHLRNVYRQIHVQRKLDMLLKFIDQIAMYVNTSTDITQPVINAYKAGFDAKSGGKNHIAGH